MSHPYQDLENAQFWNRSVAGTETHLYNPVFGTKFEISPTENVATAGSCFAQHIANGLRNWGCRYLVCEDGAQLPLAERTRRHYGLFSARYGNVYTSCQLNQLFDEAFGWRTPHEKAWHRTDGRWIDPARQQVEPDGFASIEDVLEDRQRHLAAVRRVFTEADVFVFTLGLTEAWRSRVDGSVFSSAPGVIAGNFDSGHHEFVNFDIHENYSNLHSFLIKLKAINQKIKVFLTVSPVPLAATFENNSVVCATTYSKSILRVVAEMAKSEFEWIDYYPSFEIITGSQAHGQYFEEDARQVNMLGVAHAMRIFMQEYIPAAAVTDRTRLPMRNAESMPVFCDEEALDAIAI